MKILRRNISDSVNGLWEDRLGLIQFFAYWTFGISGIPPHFIAAKGFQSIRPIAAALPEVDILKIEWESFECLTSFLFSPNPKLY